MISFHKLGPYRDDFTRSIEKQLIFTEGECFNFKIFIFIQYEFIILVKLKKFSDLQLLLFVYNKKITTSDVGHISEVNTYENLLSVLKQFDETLVCQGALPSKPFDDINSSYGYQFVESYGMWRHIKCCTILTKDNSKNRLFILNLNNIIFYYL